MDIQINWFKDDDSKRIWVASIDEKPISVRISKEKLMDSIKLLDFDSIVYSGPLNNKNIYDKIP